MRAITWVAVGCCVAGCYVRKPVSKNTLSAVTSPQRTHAVVVRAANGDAARLDPHTLVRMKDQTGGWSRPLGAAHLYTSRRGLFAYDRAPISLATRISVHGLGIVEQHALRQSKPPGATLITPLGERWELQADPRQLDLWLRAFLDATADGYADVIGGGTYCSKVACLERLRRRLFAKNARGFWRFDFGRERSRAIPTRRLANVVDHGVRAWVGWSWHAIRSAELFEFSGPRTVGAVFGVSAAIAMMFSGGLHALAATLPAKGGPRRVFHPTSVGPPDSDARPLFSGHVRRRAAVQFIGDAGSSVASGGNWMVSGASAGVRFVDLFDVQVGFRHAYQRGAGPAVAVGFDGAAPVRDNGRHGAFMVARLGFHIPVDVDHRVAIPLSIDAGRGNGSYFRANLGVRYRLSDKLFVGAYPFNPTRLRVTTDSGDGKGVWSWQSGLELGLSY